MNLEKRKNLNSPSLKNISANVRQQSAAGQASPQKINKVKSVMAAKNVDSNLDKFSKQMDEYWKTGAIKNVLKTQSCSKFIVGKKKEKKQAVKRPNPVHMEMSPSSSQPVIKISTGGGNLKFQTPTPSIMKQQTFEESTSGKLARYPPKFPTNSVTKRGSMNIPYEPLRFTSLAAPLRELSVQKTLPRSQLSKYSNNLLPTDANDAKAIESFYENYYSEIDDHFDFGSRDGVTILCSGASKRQITPAGSFINQPAALNSPQSAWHNNRISELRSLTKQSFTESKKNIYSKSVIESYTTYKK